MKILISITSYMAKDKNYLQQVIDNYITEYTEHQLFFVLSVNYTFNFPANSISIPKRYAGFLYTWNNKEYINQNFRDYDMIIESDDDCLIPKKTFDYYINTAKDLSLEYIPGMLSMEKDTEGKEYLITMPRNLAKIKEVIELDSKKFIVPYNLHSTCFIADTERYELALLKQMKSEPYRWSFYVEPEMSRTAIYQCFKKIVGVEDIQTGAALIHHLPNKYYKHLLLKMPTKEEFLTTNKLI